MGDKRKPNRLSLEKSPYLLQHAYNPVDWYPWGKEAFEKAKNEDKPVFLSIGYSTCHWCHVMERESFEDDEVAGLMNDTFVSIKVDREERPDIDGIYMKVCQSMTGSGGWPLNIIMTPDKKPFISMTYIPKQSKFQRAGMMELIPRIKDIWKKNRKEAENIASHVILSLKEVHEEEGKELNKDVLQAAYEQLLANFDENYGGFGDAPKFPTPHNLSFLLRYFRRSGDITALGMVERTLACMRMGGIYDHIGLGFHRYSTDAAWIVPHFEKMLYDQALLTIAYIEAYQVTGNEEYRRTAREILTYVLRDMTSKDGGFYSGEDADSEGVEGKFYVWQVHELRSVLSKNSNFIEKNFNVDEAGNFREEGIQSGKNVLYMTGTISETASNFKIPAEEFQKKLEAARLELFNAREKRIHPGKDDKILADWNGLMIAAFSKCAQVFDDADYLEAAKKAADFVLSKMIDANGTLYHRYRNNDTAIPGFLDDYAFMIWGLVELYETCFDVYYLKAALNLNNILMEHFWDEKNGGFYFTSDTSEKLILRKKEIYDGAVPSGNSAAMQNLIRLGRMTANSELEKKAEMIGRTFSGSILQMPGAYTHLMSALDLMIGPMYEVVISGDPEAGDTKAMIRELRKKFIPEKVVLFRPAGTESSEIIALAGYTENLISKQGKATAYVCRNYSCQVPTTYAAEMLKSLDAF